MSQISNDYKRHFIFIMVTIFTSIEYRKRKSRRRERVERERVERERVERERSFSYIRHSIIDNMLTIRHLPSVQMMQLLWKKN